MGRIIPRTSKDGTVAYLAQIIRRRKGKTYRPFRILDRGQAAQVWLKRREKELDGGGRLAGKEAGPTLSAAITIYIADYT